MNVTFPTAMAGQTLLYNECATDDATNDNSGWWGMYGYYLLIGAANQGPPTLGTATPANGGTAPSQPFTLQITAIDPNGWTYGNLVRILISPNHDSLNACLITIIPVQGVMFLDWDDLTDWNTVYFGQGSASNHQCTLTGQGSSVSYDSTGKTLTMTLNLQFTSSFPGLNFIDEYVWDTQFGIADWGQLGAVTVGAPPIITTAPMDLGFGIASQPYSVTLNANGRQPLTWSVTSGTLPPGIISAAGV